MARAALAAVALLVLAGTACARGREVVVPVLPERSLQLAAAGDGTAWLLGKEPRGSSATLWRIDASGVEPRRIALPPLGGAPVRVAASHRDGAVWVAGLEWIASIDADGLASQFLEERAVQGLAVIGRDRAVLSRERLISNSATTPGAEVLLLRRRDTSIHIEAVERFAGYQVRVDGLVADGHDGFWARLWARSSDGRVVTGYLHRDGGGWRAWVPGGVWPDFVEAPSKLRVVGATPAALGPSGWVGSLVTADGAAGFYADAAERRQLYRVAADGTAALVPPERLGGRGNLTTWKHVANDDAALLILTGGAHDEWYPRKGGEAYRLTWFDGGDVTRTERVPTPRWGGPREWPSGSVAAGDGVQWLACPGLVMRRSSGVWTSFSSADLMERLARKRWERRREVAVLILGALLGAALSVGVGALLLGRLSRRSVPGVAAHIVAGSLLALPPTLLVLAVNPLVEPWDQYGIAAMFFIMGCLGAVALAAMGSFGFASWRRPAPALAAAVMGSITGITAAIFADGGLYRMIDDLPFETVSFRWAVAAGLVGLFAAIGCQLSGGPRPAADQNAVQRTP